MMPRIRLGDPFGTPYEIDSRNDATILAWFDEVLPLVRLEDKRGKIVNPTIMILPMLVPGQPPDWLMDGSVLGRVHQFRAADGAAALLELDELRALLEAELRTHRR